MNQFPNDKSTVFSIHPFGMLEFKPGLYPGSFTVPGCFDDSEPQRLVVGTSEHLIAVAGRKESIRVTTPSYEVARSIVQDFLDGQFFASPEEHPGICWLQGEVSLADFKTKHKDRLAEMQAIQRRWFMLVVKKTQDDWNKYHNSRVVSDVARFAVKALELEIPEWMTVDTMGTKPTKCPACGTVNDPSNAWCSNCITGGMKIPINQAKFDQIMKLVQK